MDDKPHHFDAVTGDQDMIKALTELEQRFLRGEIRCAALRVFKLDGTWEDVVVGGTPEEQEAALANLQQAHQRAH